MKIKSYRIYHKPSGTWVEVSYEMYIEITRYRTRIRKYEQYHDRCMCTRKKWWLCDAMCQDCEFHAPGDTLSLDLPSSNQDGDEITLLDTLADTEPLIEDAVCDMLQFKELIAKLESEIPEARIIIELRLKNVPDTAIAKKLHISRTTMLSRWKKALEKLGIRRSDFFNF